MSINIEITSFPIESGFEQKIEEFVNQHAQGFDIKGCFGPVVNPDNNKPHVFILFSKNRDGE